ncbi:hypothetical protein [Williamsia sterculiae]|uniref:Uncharacterized protein n=1 Tax=Williamsia sterculiae TaxID=1344003 RepID=A0A1N7HEK7_9NOCA|nr:hypothetical protein [Williamsia sterculiae]SIS23295.1 hypothetical protein SAMN05445060_4092 [Williamsia sterculiae]
MITAGVLATLIAGATAPALADPGQGGITPDAPAAPPSTGQGGVTPDSPSTPPTGQGGVTPDAPAPAPAPAPTPEPTPEPAPQTGPSFVPAPTYIAPPVEQGSPEDTQPTYQGAYNPLPQTPLHLPTPVAPKRPVIPKPLPHPGKIVLSRNVWLPQGPVSDADARNLDGQFADAEARVDTFYRSIGFTDDQADRSATATVLGGVAGATLTGFTVFVPAEIILGGGGALLGCGIGALAALPIPPQGISSAVGCGIGAAAGGGAGTLAATGLAAAAAAAGGAVGAGLGYAFGAGDPGGDPNAPLGGPTTENPQLSKPAPPHPEANQYELHVNNTPVPGNPKVDYTVNKSGDVNGHVDVGPIHAPISVSHEQSQNAFAAAGPLSRTVSDTVTQAAVNLSKQAEQAIPGLKVAFPQFGGGNASSSGPKHAASGGRHAAKVTH